MQKVVLILTIAAISFSFSGCLILSTNPVSGVICIAPGEQQTLIVSADSRCEYKWYKNGTLMPQAIGSTYTFTAGNENSIDTIRLTVLKGFMQESRIWSIYVVEPAYGGAALQDTLYTLYAGIGYNSAADHADNENLYNFMFNDLNLLMGKLIQSILSEPIDQKALSDQLLSGNKQILSYTGQGVNAELAIQMTLLHVTFSTADFYADIDLTADFSNNATFSEAPHYKGDEGTIDFEAAGSVHLFLSTDDEARQYSIKSGIFNISAFDSLIASYENHIATYNGWQISYEVSSDSGTNMHLMPTALSELIPDDSEYPDNRNYILSGSFSIDNNIYRFDDGIQYRQQQNIENSEANLFVNGSLKIPETEETISVSNTAGAIIRNSDGRWITGGLDIFTEQGVEKVLFKNSGEAAFIVEGVAVGSWQDTLDPF